MRWQCQMNFKTWGGLQLTSLYHNLRHPMHLNHMIPSCRWWFPSLSKETLCHDSEHQRGQPFPSGWVTHSYIRLVVRYVQSTTCLHCAVLLKLWCSTVDLSQCCFTVWPLPKQSHNMKSCSSSFLIMNYVNYTVTLQGTSRPYWLLKLFRAHILSRNIYFKMIMVPQDLIGVSHSEDKQLLPSWSII